jgi:hypothetical protein
MTTFFFLYTPQSKTPVKQLKILFNQLSPTLFGCVFPILNIELTGKSKKVNISFG